MAKSKRKKEKNIRKNNAPVSAAPANIPAPTKEEERTRTAPAPKSPSKQIGKELKNEATGAVRLSTCLAGMFLTLCLGLYLGSLIPDIAKDLRTVSFNAQNQAPASMPTLAEKPEKPEAATPQPVAEKAPAQERTPAISPALQQHMRHLEEEAAQNPEDAKLLSDLGNAYFDSGQSKKAIEAYEKALAINPANSDVLTDLGIMYREEKNYDKALECFRKAVDLNPRHLNALFNQGVVLGMDQHRHEEAKAAWQRLLEIYPEARTPDGKKVSDLIRQLEQPQHN